MPVEPGFPAPDPREIDPRAVRRAFGRAAATYDAAAALQREVGARMASRLDYVKVAPKLVLDAGCGTGEAVGELTLRYPQAAVVALDLALPMVVAARERARRGRSLLQRLLPAALSGASSAPWLVCGDVNALPMRGALFDLVWSNLALQWVNDLPRAFDEIRRVLKVGGLFTFSTFGPDTLRELRRAFAHADGNTHTSRFTDMHDIGDMLVHTGFAEPVMDMEEITLTYADPDSLLRELKRLGATNATRGRSHGLMGRTRWRKVLSALETMRRDGRIPATFEVVYGHAWKAEPARSAEGYPIVKLSRRGEPVIARVFASKGARGVFVTGTDTGVGKTHVATALLRAMVASGVRAAGMKPVAAGIEPGGSVNDDVALLAAADGLELPMSDRCPYAFAPAIAPHLAARDVGTEIDLAVIEAAWRRMSKVAEAIVVEGAGGVAVPLGAQDDMLDIAHRLHLPVLLVVGVRLGCLNHALLSASAIRERGLRLGGWVANRIDPAMARAQDNVAELASRLDAPLIADLSWNGPASIDADGLRRLGLAGAAGRC